MSYDMYFFQLADGVTVEEINAFLKSDEHDADCDRRMGEDQDADDEDLDEEDPTLIPARFINMELAEEALQHILFRSWIKQATKAEERSEAMREYLEGKTEETPAECEDDFECIFEYGGEPGMQPMMLSYGGGLDGTLSLIAKMLEDLQPQRIALFDPQMGQVVDGDSRATLLQSGEEATQQFADLIHQIETEGFVFGNAEEEEEEQK